MGFVLAGAGATSGFFSGAAGREGAAGAVGFEAALITFLPHLPESALAQKQANAATSW